LVCTALTCAHELHVRGEASARALARHAVRVSACATPAETVREQVVARPRRIAMAEPKSRIRLKSTHVAAARALA
jgi:hypothetical protein